jgi:hypothetical protein
MTARPDSQPDVRPLALKDVLRNAIAAIEAPTDPNLAGSKSAQPTIQRDTRRYEFRNKIKTIDLGLTLDDVKAERLASEYQYHAKGDKSALMDNLRENGATEEEIEFMFQDFDRLRSTRRVELNAMTSPQFIRFVERKLRQHGFKKIIPNQDLLAETYLAMERGRRLEIEAEKIEKIDMKGVKAPKNLKPLVEAELKKNPSTDGTRPSLRSSGD